MCDFNILAIDYGDPDGAARFARSLHETGFAVIGGHPVGADEIAGMYACWSRFFEGEGKCDYAADPATMYGYFGLRSENAKGNTAKDLKEFYHVYQDCPVPPEVEGPTRSFHAKLLEIGTELLGWLDAESPPEVRARFSEPLVEMVAGSGHNLLRVLHYPPLDDSVATDEMRAAAHEDINLITLLVTGSEPGLQARDTAGRWHDVPCHPGMITVNAGDMLAKASRNHYPSTSHRVVNPPERENRSRYSMPLFVHPRPEVELDARYTAESYLNERLKEIGLKAEPESGRS